MPLAHTNIYDTCRHDNATTQQPTPAAPAAPRPLAAPLPRRLAVAGRLRHRPWGHARGRGPTGFLAEGRASVGARRTRRSPLDAAGSRGDGRGFPRVFGAM